MRDAIGRLRARTRPRQPAAVPTTRAQQDDADEEEEEAATDDDATTPRFRSIIPRFPLLLSQQVEIIVDKWMMKLTNDQSVSQCVVSEVRRSIERNRVV